MGNRLKDLFFLFEVLKVVGFFFFPFVIEDSICPLLFIPFFLSRVFYAIPSANSLCNVLFLLCTVEVTSIVKIFTGN